MELIGQLLRFVTCGNSLFLTFVCALTHVLFILSHAPVAVDGGSTCLPFGYAAALGDCDSDARLQFNPVRVVHLQPAGLLGWCSPLFFVVHQKAASFQVLDDIASLRQGIASIAMNAGSVDNALQTVAGLTQQLVPGVSGLP